MDEGTRVRCCVPESKTRGLFTIDRAAAPDYKQRWLPPSFASISFHVPSQGGTWGADTVLGDVKLTDNGLYRKRDNTASGYRVIDSSSGKQVSKQLYTDVQPVG